MWCEIHHIPLTDVVLMGSSALLFHGLIDVCNDIDLILPKQYAVSEWDFLADSVTTVAAKIDLRIAWCGFERAVVNIDGLQVTSLPQLLHDYEQNIRAKDLTKLITLRSALETSAVTESVFAPLPLVVSKVCKQTTSGKRIRDVTKNDDLAAMRDIF
jgi:hypothetical protein